VAALLFAKVVSAEAGGVCGITTHPPAPSQGEGVNLRAVSMLLKKNGQFLTFAFEIGNNREKAFPFPLGRGQGMGSRPNTSPSLRPARPPRKAAPLTTPVPRTQSSVPANLVDI
jgi:hypothetical protein